MMDEVRTPRSGRTKKKSTLSRLAAQKTKRRPADGSEESSAVSLRQAAQDSEDLLQPPRYPIEANVEVTNHGPVEDGDDDSDEGIGMASNSYERQYERPRLSPSSQLNSRTTEGINHAKPESHDSNHSHSNVSPRLSSKSTDDHSSALTPGDEYKPKVKSKLSPFNKAHALSDSDDDNDDDDDDVQIATDLKQNLLKPRTSNKDVNKSPRLNSRKAHLNDQLSPPVMDKSPRSPSSRDETLSDDSNEVNGPYYQKLSPKPLARKPHHSHSQEDLLKEYEEALTKNLADSPLRRNNLDQHERDELLDSCPDLRSSSPQPGLRHTFTAQNPQLLLGSDRPWSASVSHQPQFDMMSQRSYQSTSALPAITTKEAKGRSFLVGSINSRCALLGGEELERYFPDRKMRVFIGTWNMAEIKVLNDSFDDFLLPDACDYVQDMYVIGTQESAPNRKEWEIRLQETLGPQHVLFHTAVHGALYLLIFVRRDLIWFCSVPEDDYISTRAGPSQIKTKGAVAVSFLFFGTSFLFINCHLTPYDGKMKERIADYHRIISGINLPKNSNTATTTQDDVTKRFDCVFWCGDMNFRLLRERNHVDHAVQGIESKDFPDYEDLVMHDELFKARNEGLAFQDFQEGRITFSPTYKFDIGTDVYDTSKKLRIPSYTDRVLFRTKRKSAISCLHYDSVPSVKCSDHRPVYCMFEVNIRPGRDNVNLAAGLFNREVWLEGNKRRSESLTTTKKTQKASTVCSLQ